MNDSAAAVAWSHPGGSSSPLRWIDGGRGFFNTYVLCHFEALLSVFPIVVVVLIFYSSNCKNTKTCHLSQQTLNIPLRKTCWRTLKPLNIQKNVGFFAEYGTFKLAALTQPTLIVHVADLNCSKMCH